MGAATIAIDERVSFPVVAPALSVGISTAASQAEEHESVDRAAEWDGFVFWRGLKS